MIEEPIPTGLAGFEQRAFEELRAQDPVTEDAPDGVVLVRMVVSNQACAELGDAPPRIVAAHDGDGVIDLNAGIP